VCVCASVMCVSSVFLLLTTLHGVPATDAVVVLAYSRSTIRRFFGMNCEGSFEKLSCSLCPYKGMQEVMRIFNSISFSYKIKMRFDTSVWHFSMVSNKLMSH